MSPVPHEQVDQMKKVVLEVLEGTASNSFLTRVDAVIADWESGKLTAAQAIEKIEKMVALFIDKEKARQIASRCAPIIMRYSVPGK